jgi:hypothetical protein
LRIWEFSVEFVKVASFGIVGEVRYETARRGGRIGSDLEERMAVSPFAIVLWVGAVRVWEELSGLVRVKARDNDMGASGIGVVGVESQNGVESLAPPFDELTVIQDMLCAVVDTSGEEVLVLCSGEERDDERDARSLPGFGEPCDEGRGEWTDRRLALLC